jgi:hypothetical protein
LDRHDRPQLRLMVSTTICRPNHLLLGDPSWIPLATCPNRSKAFVFPFFMARVARDNISLIAPLHQIYQHMSPLMTPRTHIGRSLFIKVELAPIHYLYIHAGRDPAQTWLSGISTSMIARPYYNTRHRIRGTDGSRQSKPKIIGPHHIAILPT